MRSIHTLTLSLALALGAGACSSDLEDAIGDWASRSCECKDKACAEKMADRFDEIEHKYRDDIKDLSESEAKKLDKPYRKGSECLEQFDVHAG